jgi:2-(1,2-epoxy-1,2-dihydrophenyl)acetyl-CoA isomerase
LGTIRRGYDKEAKNMHYETISVEKRDGIAILTFNRPATKNAWNAEMQEETTNAIEEINKDENARVLIITGAGRGFSIGADVKDELSRVVEGASETIFKRITYGCPSLLNIMLQLRKMDKPVIGAINGIAAGGGLSVALACDIRIASEKAWFCAAFILRGLIPDAGCSFFLPKLIGSAKACELAFTGDIIDAKEAERIGLVNKVVPHKELMQSTEELAAKLVKRPPIALKYSKRAIYKGLAETDLPSHLDYEVSLNRMCSDTEDFKEGVMAFLEKREPTFKGR